MADEEWERIYARQDVIDLPWFFPALDQDVKKFISQRKLSAGNFLDIGTGPGTQAVGLAKLGFSVTGTDISQTAISGATALAGREGVTVNFLVDDILDTKLPPNHFNFILDRGVFHSLSHPQRLVLAKNARRLLAPAGLYFLKCFSDRNPGSWGPQRFSKGEVLRYFERYFDILQASETRFQGTLSPEPHALFFVMRIKK